MPKKVMNAKLKRGEMVALENKNASPPGLGTNTKKTKMELSLNCPRPQALERNAQYDFRVAEKRKQKAADPHRAKALQLSEITAGSRSLSFDALHSQQSAREMTLRSRIETVLLVAVWSPLLFASGDQAIQNSVATDDCQVTPVIHVLQYPGCVPKPIPSFACTGRCSSYLQVSGSKIWQMERSCMCCQESGEREASVSLFCPKAKPGERKFRKVSTKAPLECMCRPCTGVEESAIIPQEIAGYADEGPLSNHFRKSQ